MGESIGTVVQIGGRLRRQLVADLESLLLEDGDGVEDAAKANKCLTTVGSTNYGNAEDLCAFLEANGLTYRREADGHYEFPGEIVWWSPTETFDTQGDGTGSDPVVTMAALKRDLAAGKSLADVVAALAWTEREVPALVLVDDDGGEA